jgi:uncharacterized DUF497 family protein
MTPPTPLIKGGAGDLIRLISARVATRAEREAYEED